MIPNRLTKKKEPKPFTKYLGENIIFEGLGRNVVYTEQFSHQFKGTVA